MTTENNKKNPDYSESAVGLCNPESVEELLVLIHEHDEQISVLQHELKEKNKDLLFQIEYAEKLRDEVTTRIKEMIDRYGSYQDTKLGWYAIKQRRESIEYKPELVRQYAPSKVASFVLIESVDKKALEALIKAGQITSENAKQCGEVTESYAYIIK